MDRVAERRPHPDQLPPVKQCDTNDRTVRDSAAFTVRREGYALEWSVFRRGDRMEAYEPRMAFTWWSISSHACRALFWPRNAARNSLV